MRTLSDSTGAKEIGTAFPQSQQTLGAAWRISQSILATIPVDSNAVYDYVTLEPGAKPSDVISTARLSPDAGWIVSDKLVHILKRYQLRGCAFMRAVVQWKEHHLDGYHLLYST